MAALPRYPLLVDLTGRACLVVGGGTVAARKVRGLLDAGAIVTVVAVALGEDLAAAVARGEVVWRRTAVSVASVERELFDADFDAEVDPVDAPPDRGGSGWWLVVAATDDPVLNHAVVESGQRRGVWGNDATDPQGGPVSVPAVHRAGPVTVAVATGGVSPSAAVWLRDELAGAVDPAVVEALAILAEVRAELGASSRAPSGSAGASHEATTWPGAVPGQVGGHAEQKPARSDWRTVLDSGMLDDIREGRRAKAKERLKACLSSSSD